MDAILYFFFSIRLFTTIVTEVFFLFLRLSIGTKTVFFSFLLLVYMIGATGMQLLFPDPSTQPQIITEKDRQAAETRIAFWESVVASSPVRDAFLNLEKLYRYLGEDSQALIYRERAFELDPNSPIFEGDSFRIEPMSSLEFQESTVEGSQ